MSCDSCGDTDDVLTEVVRLYLTPSELGEPGEPEAVRRATSTERWCTVCQLHYPHEPVDDPTDGVAAP